MHCAAAAGPPGWTGRTIEPAGPAHLDGEALDAYLKGSGPGSTVEHQDARFTTAVGERLLGALRVPGDGRPYRGGADFAQAVFMERLTSVRRSSLTVVTGRPSTTVDWAGCNEAVHSHSPAQG
ncbi:hypothetical protein [Streptomyces sp. NPDC086766]|uniref:hypothetical protein n=1 Tax=Streptomyces sp. NPDC086766 TaxID=3365754 RepID=UPI00380B98D3